MLFSSERQKRDLANVISILSSLGAGGWVGEGIKGRETERRGSASTKGNGKIGAAISDSK